MARHYLSKRVVARASKEREREIYFIHAIGTTPFLMWMGHYEVES